jgi:hypothetical protein
MGYVCYLDDLRVWQALDGTEIRLFALSLPALSADGALEGSGVSLRGKSSLGDNSFTVWYRPVLAPWPQECHLRVILPYGRLGRVCCLATANPPLPFLVKNKWSIMSLCQSKIEK